MTLRVRIHEILPPKGTVIYSLDCDAEEPRFRSEATGEILGMEYHPVDGFFMLIGSESGTPPYRLKGVPFCWCFKWNPGVYEHVPTL